MKSAIFLVAAAAALVACPAFAQNSGEQWHHHDPSRQACLQVGRVWNWYAPDNRTLIVEDNVHKKYKLELLGFCPGLKFTQHLGFRSIGGFEISCLTPGDTVFFHDTGMATRCSISKISAYTPEMEKADKAAREKKK